MSFHVVPTVEVGELASDAFLLDVREDDEWRAGHAAEAVHIPMSEFVARFGELTVANENDARVYVICRSGGRSAQVAQYLNQQGMDAVNIAGGMESWLAAGRPVVDDTGSGGAVL